MRNEEYVSYMGYGRTWHELMDDLLRACCELSDEISGDPAQRMDIITCHLVSVIMDEAKHNAVRGD